jgi:hypothetical protein
MDKQSKASFILKLVQFSAKVINKSNPILSLLTANEIQYSTREEKDSKLKEIFEKFLEDSEFENEVDQLMLDVVEQVDFDKIIEKYLKEENV